MPSIFSSLYTLKRAMGAQQYALNTTAHNIANANTDGYSRQRVTMEASRPEGVNSVNSSFGPGQLGTGVDVSEVTRSRDYFLDAQIRNETGTLETFKAREQFLSEIETIFMEPSENGLSNAMGEMWDSWQQLSAGPENSTLRNGVIENSRTVTDMMNHAYYQLENLEINSDDLAKGQVYDMNQVITEIENLNQQIMGVRIGGNNPNDFLDKQDLLIDKLSGMINISVKRGPLGQAIIKSDDISLVGGNKKNLSFVKSIDPVDSSDLSKGYVISYYSKGDTSELKALQIDNDKYNSLMGAKIIWTDDTGNYIEKALPDEGSIKGFASIYTEIKEYKNQLDSLAKGIAYAVNTIMNDGDVPYDISNNPPTKVEGYIPFFVSSDGMDDGTISAKNITVNRELESDPTKIKTYGKKEVILEDPSDPDSPIKSITYYPENNGDRAIAIAQLRDSRLFMNELLVSDSIVTSARFDDPVVSGLTGGPKNLVIKSGGMEESISIANGDTLQTIADRINSSDTIKSMSVRAVVENNRLIIQNMKSENNAVSVTDNDDGNVLGALKIYGKDSMELRVNNSIVNSYNKKSTSMKISDDTKGTTIGNYFKDTIAMLGSSARQAEGMITSQDALVSQLDVRKESVSGVSMDEEMANLIQYQKAYQAAAKMVSIMDELLDTIINNMVR